MGGSADPSLRVTGPVRAHLPLPPSGDDVAWPSQWWTGHECANKRRCEHRMPLPDWWLLMAKRGVPFHPDAEVAFQAAMTRIRTYKGSQPVFDQTARELVQGIVIDALVVAPQPVGNGWVHTSLMTVGGLVRWAMLNGEPLDRDHLLSTHTRNRFINLGTKDLLDTSRRNYKCRLDLIAATLTGVPVAPTTTRASKAVDATEPHSDIEIATLWVWANGLSPQKRRDRIAATMVLALGCGLRAGELAVVTRESVMADTAGVHVQVVDRHGEARLVTCDQAWEERLLTLVDNAQPGHPLTRPWAAAPSTARALQNATANAQHAYAPPEWFSVTSLRNTWLVRHLTRGTPVPVLLKAAGIESIEALKPHLAFVLDPSDEQRAAFLRGSAR